MTNITGMPAMTGVTDMARMTDMTGMPDMTRMTDMAGITDMTGMPDMARITDMTGMPWLEVPGTGTGERLASFFYRLLHIQYVAQQFLSRGFVLEVWRHVDPPPLHGRWPFQRVHGRHHRTS